MIILFFRTKLLHYQQALVNIITVNDPREGSHLLPLRLLPNSLQLCEGRQLWVSLTGVLSVGMSLHMVLWAASDDSYSVKPAVSGISQLG